MRHKGYSRVRYSVSFIKECVAEALNLTSSRAKGLGPDFPQNKPAECSKTVHGLQTCPSLQPGRISEYCDKPEGSFFCQSDTRRGITSPSFAI